jgi:Histidine kinase-like ATPase domain
MGSDTDAGQSHRPDDEAGQRAAVRAGTAAPLRWRQVLRGEEHQLGEMRRWLSSLLPDCPERADVLSVANELCSNAIQHTASGRSGWFAVEVVWYPSVVQIAVADCGGPGEPHVIDDPNGERGRGLLLVRALSVRTGFVGDQRGRLVWAQIAWNDPESPTLVASAGPYQAAIRDGEATLARRFAGVPAWFGRATLRWWALPGPGVLISASSAPELAALLYRLEEAVGPRRPGAARQPHRVLDEEPGRPLTREPDIPPPRAQPGTRSRPGSPGNDRLDSRGRPGRPHWPPGTVPCRAWVLSSSSRAVLVPAVR